MENNEPIIKIQDLRKVFKGDVGVKDINFEVFEGEIFGFLGPNGAGKSTTIKMMLDIIRPDKGSIHIFGKEVKEHSIFIRKNVGYLPGEFKALDGLTGEAFLNLSENIKNTNYDIEPLLEQLSLQKSALKRKIKTYSQGMKQKLGIINAIASNPKLLILDEPSSGLDPIIQFKLYDLLQELCQQGTTILFSSHNLPEVERICDRVAVIKEGQLVTVSRLEELRQNQQIQISLTLENEIDNLLIEGATLIHQDGNKYKLSVDADINKVMNEINKLKIKDIVIPEPSLEQIFKSYYEN